MSLKLYIIGYYSYDNYKLYEKIDDREYFTNREKAYSAIMENTRASLENYKEIDVNTWNKLNDTELLEFLNKHVPDHNVPKSAEAIEENTWETFMDKNKGECDWWLTVTIDN